MVTKGKKKKNWDKYKIEEVPVKWMDRPSATVMERGCASEMDGRKSSKNMEILLK